MPFTAPCRPRLRRPYAPPELIEYGTVAKLTQTGSGSVNDFIGMMMMMSVPVRRVGVSPHSARPLLRYSSHKAVSPSRQGAPCGSRHASTIRVIRVP